jgi:hypothetical protein
MRAEVGEGLSAIAEACPRDHLAVASSPAPPALEERATSGAKSFQEGGLPSWVDRDEDARMDG